MGGVWDVFFYMLFNRWEKLSQTRAKHSLQSISMFFFRQGKHPVLCLLGRHLPLLCCCLQQCKITLCFLSVAFAQKWTLLWPVWREALLSFCHPGTIHRVKVLSYTLNPDVGCPNFASHTVLSGSPFLFVLTLCLLLLYFSATNLQTVWAKKNNCLNQDDNHSTTRLP